MMDLRFSFPPWTFEQVRRLNARQVRDDVRPATCHCGAVLRASPRGWRCDDEWHASVSGERAGRVVRAWALASVVEGRDGFGGPAA